MKVPRTTSGKYTIEVVTKALDVLEAFDGNDLTLNEISQRVGLNKSRTFRLLCTLVEREFVERTADGSRYKLGIKLLERAALVRRDLREVARPFMLELQERFNEMINLGVLDGREILYLDIIESSRHFRMSATVGCRRTADQTALGKAILAYLHADDPASPAHILLGRRTRPQLQALCRELQTVRQRGYAIDDEEIERGVGCIGGPILDTDGYPMAAISISGLAHRILDREKPIAEAVAEACQGISKRMGLSSTDVSRPAGTRFASALAN